MAITPKTRFFISNFLKGLLWLALFVIAFILFKKFGKVDYLGWLKPIYENILLVFTIFTISEIVIGIIPPEIFFIWATGSGNQITYIQFAILLSVISYLAGMLGFWFGKKLNQTILFRYLKRRYLAKYVHYVNEYGLYLIIVAAMTPIPFSGTAMLMGSVNYPFNRYLIYALSRFVRFAIYTVVFWEVLSYQIPA
jgi:membrane protein DedA with SNARE-associated domain